MVCDNDSVLSWHSSASLDFGFRVRVKVKMRVVERDDEDLVQMRVKVRVDLHRDLHSQPAQSFGLLHRLEDGRVQIHMQPPSHRALSLRLAMLVLVPMRLLHEQGRDRVIEV